MYLCFTSEPPTQEDGKLTYFSEDGRAVPIILTLLYRHLDKKQMHMT
jgi:hypothetical protein